MFALTSTALLLGFVLRAPNVPRTSLRGSPSPLFMAAGNEAISFPELDGKHVRVGIIRARWHAGIIDDLIDGAKASLKACGVDEDAIIETEVAGAFELPLAARYLALSGQVDAILPVGVLIKGMMAFWCLAHVFERLCGSANIAPLIGVRPPGTRSPSRMATCHSEATCQSHRD